ncbi:MAG TPA: sigma-70 family RNA polymerase sigma factor [Gaiellaceae bacterium]|jgi:RNA polymerase sigma-70 factor (ECF subfamily)
MQRSEEIYAEHHDAVRAYVRRRAHEDVVDDIVSETFLVCLRKIDVVPDEALPWLYAVARKTLANHRRRLARQAPAHAGVGGEPDPVGDVLLAAAFAELSERDREVLRLVAWEGLPLRDAAVALGCSAVACRVRYHRAKSRLASRLSAAASFRPDTEGVTR